MFIAHRTLLIKFIILILLLQIVGEKTEKENMTNQTSLMFDLPEEILTEIISVCVSYVDVKAFLCSSKVLNTRLQVNMKNIKEGSYILNKFQLETLKCVKENKGCDFYIKIPLSGGKTSLALTLASKHEGLSIIIVPSNLLEMYRLEYIKMNLERKLLNYNSYTHKKYIESFDIDDIIKGNISGNEILLISSQKEIFWNNCIQSIFGIKKLIKDINKNTLVIFEGTQLDSVRQSFELITQDINCSVHLSTEDLEPLKSERNVKTLKYKNIELEECLPKVIFKPFIKCDESNILSFENLSYVLRILVKNIETYIKNNKGRTFLLIPSKFEFIRYCVELKDLWFELQKNEEEIVTFSMLLNHFTDFEFINYENTSSSSIKNNDNSNLVLVSNINKISNVININNIENILFIVLPHRLNELSPRLYRNKIERTVRIENKNKVINVTNMLIPSEMYLKDDSYTILRNRITKEIYNFKSWEEFNKLDDKYVINGCICYLKNNEQNFDNLKAYSRLLTLSESLEKQFMKVMKIKKLKYYQWNYSSDPYSFSDREFIARCYFRNINKKNKNMIYNWCEQTESTNKNKK